MERRLAQVNMPEWLAKQQKVVKDGYIENLNQARSDRQTVELRFSLEGVLNRTWIRTWTQKGISLCEMDPRKRSVTSVFMFYETSV